MEGTFAGSVILKVLNAYHCLVCNEAIQDRAAYAIGAPYHAMCHIRCIMFFGFDGRYPHPMPAVYYDPPPMPPTLIPNQQPLRASQDDNGFSSLQRRQ